VPRHWPLAIALALVILVAPATAQQGKIVVPAGFQIDVFAAPIAGARFMTIDPAGTLLLSVPRQGRIVALPDRDGRAETTITVVDGLDQPHGLAFHDGALFVAETGKVKRFRYDAATRKASDGRVVVANLPSGGNHWTRTIVFGRDGAMFVSIGSSCNVCDERDRRRAAVVQYNADGSGETLFASGLRNAVGLAVHPGTGVLWATVNERDWRGDDLPPDYVTTVERGRFYGWPPCFASAGKVVPDPDAKSPADRCGGMALPTVEIQAHSAPLGLAFYTGKQFPAAYHGNLFVAYHGSWNRSVPTGYKVVRIPVADGKAGRPEDFATGWIHGGLPGRPVDVAVAPDGALFISADAIYRVSYREKR
jgi:glucose/arabinose dehydrogenase